MQKLQVLFPDPMMRQLKNYAAIEDCPMSEIIRRAVARLLQQKPIPQAPRKKFPTFHGGGVLIHADAMKAEIYQDDE